MHPILLFTPACLPEALKQYVDLSGTGFDEEAALLGAGREFALMKTASGKVSMNIVLLLVCRKMFNKNTVTFKAFCISNDKPHTLL